MVELSKEERRKKEEDVNLKMRQTLSLIRQGELSMENSMFVSSKVWSEDTIRNLAFGETFFFERLSKFSYEVNLAEGYQLDMPRTPTMFTVKCFQIPSTKQLSEHDYDEALIKFYSKLGQDEEKVWSLRRIEKITSIDKSEVFEGMFQNYAIKVVRSNSEEFTFTLADLPLMNPCDLIRVLKILVNVERYDLSVLIAHFRTMLKFYYHALATHDLVLAKEVRQTVEKPLVHREGLTKYQEGRILQKPVWGIVFKTMKNKRLVNGFMSMDEREKFPNEIISGIIKRVVLCEQNEDYEIKEVEQNLVWTLAVRKAMLEATYLIFQRR